jgi:hypothetical protein
LDTYWNPLWTQRLQQSSHGDDEFAGHGCKSVLLHFDFDFDEADFFISQTDLVLQFYLKKLWQKLGETKYLLSSDLVQELTPRDSVKTPHQDRIRHEF